MATLTATAATAAAPVILKPAGIPTFRVFQFDATGTTLSVSATTILMGKLPDNITITNFMAWVSSGANTAPTDYGYSGTGNTSSLSAFASQGAKGALISFNKDDALGLDISLSDSQLQYTYLTATPTVGTNTASYKVTVAITYFAR